jgi:hypothetical protein
MTWPLRRPNVTLQVAKFAPDTAAPIAGLPPDVREAHRARREAECKRVEPAYEVRKACNVWLWGNFVELVACGPDDPHPADCQCVSCVPRPEKTRQPYDELYLKQKADPWR